MGLELALGLGLGGIGICFIIIRRLVYCYFDLTECVKECWKYIGEELVRFIIPGLLTHRFAAEPPKKY